MTEIPEHLRRRAEEARRRMQEPSPEHEPSDAEIAETIDDLQQLAEELESDG